MQIYKITNMITNKIYIGKDEQDRDNYFGSGIYIKRSINKYGKQNFIKEIIEKCDNKILLCERETFWIKELDARNPKVGYNIARGGEGGDTLSQHPDIKKIGRKISKSNKGKRKGISVYSVWLNKYGKDIADTKLTEFKTKQSKNSKGSNNGMYNKKHSEETKIKIREKRKLQQSPMFGKLHSIDTKNKISKANKGNIPWIVNKHHSKETKQKISNANKGSNNGMYNKKHSEETILKMKLSQQKRREKEKYVISIIEPII